MKKKALFIDRDGTIIHDCPYCHDVSQIKLYDDTVQMMKEYMEKDYLIIIITNQSGIGRGYFSMRDYENFHNALIQKLKERGVKVDATYFCPHTPDDKCSCRKPETGLIKKAMKDFEIDIESSIVIGDRDDIDGELARRMEIDYVIINR
ncbi:D-glycero-alpha-D-manno-heptose-1,7-bisphosphate 7-phosphatase [Caldiplasma sukawensis]